MLKRLLTFLLVIGFAGVAHATATETSSVNQCMATTCTPTYAGMTLTGEESISSSGTVPNFNTPSMTLETSPSAGDWQVTANNAYFNHGNSENGAIPAMQMMALTSTRTMPSSSAAAIFNVGSSTNGTVAVTSSTTYYFEMSLYISSMSSTSGTASLTFSTTGTIGSIFYFVTGSHSTAANAVSATDFSGNVQQASATAVTTGTTTTTAVIYAHGIIRVTTGGTITPQISFSQSSTPVIAANSFFLIYPVGTNTTTTVGNIV